MELTELDHQNVSEATEWHQRLIRDRVEIERLLREVYAKFMTERGYLIMGYGSSSQHTLKGANVTIELQMNAVSESHGRDDIGARPISSVLDHEDIEMSTRGQCNPEKEVELDD